MKAEELLQTPISEIQSELELVKLPQERYKVAAHYVSVAESYVSWFKDSGSKIVLAEQSETIPNVTAENKLERLSRNTDAYKEASDLYRKALAVKEYLRTYLAAEKMQHESDMANLYKANAELKANIFSTGS